MIVECPACASRYDVTGRPPGTKARCRCGQVFLLPEPSNSARALLCPKCGGSVSPTERSCTYCEAPLMVKACPRCFERMFDGSKHCSSCGADVERPAMANEDGVARKLSCPRCESGPTMIARLVGDTLLDECPACHGVWLDRCAVDRLVRERRQASTQAVLGMGRDPSRSVADTATPGRMYRKCPECDAVMNRTNFAKRSGIILDTCRAHGTWFDADELPSVIEFVMSGGIEEAQKIEIRKQREELRRKEARLRSERSSLGSPPRAAGLGMPIGRRDANTVTVFSSLLGAVGSLLVD